MQKTIGSLEDCFLQLAECQHMLEASGKTPEFLGWVQVFFGIIVVENHVFMFSNICQAHMLSFHASWPGQRFDEKMRVAKEQARQPWLACSHSCFKFRF